MSAGICISRQALRIFAIALAFGMLSACAPTPRTPAAEAEPAKPILVFIDDSTAGFRAVAEGATRSRLKGLDVAFGPGDAGAAPLTLSLRLTYRNLTESESETIWRMTTLLLATVYPSTCQHRSYALSADLMHADGASRSYEEFDTTVAWLWLFQGPRCGETPSADEVASVSRRMLDAVYDRMFADKAFEPMPPGMTRVTSPLVQVTANRAAEITAQVLRVDRPFERWTMDSEPAEAPAHHVELFYDVRPRGFSIGRAYMSIMTFGLTGMCKPTPIALIATLTSPASGATVSHSVAETARGRFAGTDCEVQDETTRPEVFARLLRKLLPKISRDNAQAPAGTASGTGEPWVQVTSNIAEGIVRNSTIQSRLFRRYTFAEIAGHVPDYSLTLVFEFQGGGRRELSTAEGVRAGLALAWFGRNQMCNPGILVLDAVLSDRTRREVRRYHLSRPFEFSGDTDPNDCSDTEFTNPQVVIDAIAWLYAEMRADGALALVTGDRGR
jgi:hypothetical protein